jgi:hypothetical protein
VITDGILLHEGHRGAYAWFSRMRDGYLAKLSGKPEDVPRMVKADDTGYAGVDVAMVFAAASRGVHDLDVFASEVAAWLQQRPASPS